MEKLRKGIGKEKVGKGGKRWKRLRKFRKMGKVGKNEKDGLKVRISRKNWEIVGNCWERWVRWGRVEKGRKLWEIVENVENPGKWCDVLNKSVSNENIKL